MSNILGGSGRIVRAGHITMDDSLFQPGSPFLAKTCAGVAKLSPYVYVSLFLFLSVSDQPIYMATHLSYPPLCIGYPG